jgi:hypothetical protein
LVLSSDACRQSTIYSSLAIYPKHKVRPHQKPKKGADTTEEHNGDCLIRACRQSEYTTSFYRNIPAKRDTSHFTFRPNRRLGNRRLPDDAAPCCGDCQRCAPSTSSSPRSFAQIEFTSHGYLPATRQLSPHPAERLLCLLATSSGGGGITIRESLPPPRTTEHRRGLIGNRDSPCFGGLPLARCRP